MTLTLYHAPYSRSVRVRWLMEEMGLDYEIAPVALVHGDAGGAEYARINPIQKIPSLIDGDETILESVAIMQYLMARYGPTELAVKPDDPAFGRYLQFLHFGEAGLSMGVNLMLGHLVLLPEEKRNPAMARWAEGEVKKALKLVELTLGDHDYLAADRFTAADISVGYMLLLLKLMKRFNVVAGPATRDYWPRLKERAAWKAAMAD